MSAIIYCNMLDFSQNVRFQGGIGLCTEKCQLDQVNNSRLIKSPKYISEWEIVDVCGLV